MDMYRQTLVWVDDFTIDQASIFFDNVGCLALGERFDANGTDLNKQLRLRLFESIGTQPSALENIANDLANVAPDSLAKHVDPR
jgi:hypothetical protein